MSTQESKIVLIAEQIGHAMRHIQLADELARGGAEEGDTQALPAVVVPREADAPVSRRRALDKTVVATSPVPDVDEDSKTRPVAASGPAPQGWKWTGRSHLSREIPRASCGGQDLPPWVQTVCMRDDDVIMVEYFCGGRGTTWLGPTEVPLSVVRALVDKRRTMLEVAASG